MTRIPISERPKPVKAFLLREALARAQARARVLRVRRPSPPWRAAARRLP